jgi:hypothetical protein
MLDHPIGRWSIEDPKGFTAEDMNLYRYCGNDPTNLTDPAGLAPTIKSTEKPLDEDEYGAFIVPGTNGEGKVEVWGDAEVAFSSKTYEHAFAVRYSGPNAKKVDFIQFASISVDVLRRTAENAPVMSKWEEGNTLTETNGDLKWSQGPSSPIWSVDHPAPGSTDPRLIKSRTPMSFRDHATAVFADVPGVAPAAVKFTVDKYYNEKLKSVDKTVVSVIAKADFRTYILMDDKVVGIVRWDAVSTWAKKQYNDDVDPTTVTPKQVYRIRPFGRLPMEAKVPKEQRNRVAPRPDDAEIKNMNGVIDNELISSIKKPRYVQGPYLK